MTTEDKALAGTVESAGEPAAIADAEGLACPAPIPEDQRVILGHGSGGQMSAALMRDLLGPALASASPGGVLNDAAIVDPFGDAPYVLVVLSHDDDGDAGPRAAIAAIAHRVDAVYGRT